MIKTAVYPGSFDPISYGHLDIIERIANVFENVIVLIASNPGKKYTFSVDEREDFVKRVTSHLKNVKIVVWNLLVMDYAKQLNNNVVLIRGIRNANDYLNEITLYQFNHSINKDVETLVMFPSLNNVFVSSSTIKDVALFSDDLSQYIPKSIMDEVIEKIRNKHK